jgi:hypothetical protein
VDTRRLTTGAPLSSSTIISIFVPPKSIPILTDDLLPNDSIFAAEFGHASEHADLEK